MEERQRSRKKKESPEGGMTKRTAVIAAACAGAVIAACAGFYVYKSVTYKNTFLPGTWLNGQSVAGMTVEEAEHLIDEGARNYSLSLGLRGGESETLKGSEIGLHTVFDGSLDRVIEQQNPYAWPAGLFHQVEYTLDTMVAFDEEKLKEKLDSFACFDETTTQAPMDASISAYQEGSGYSIIPETEGSRVKEDEALEAVKAAVTSLRESISFEEEGLYEEPALTKDSEALVAVADTLNRYVGTKVTYKFGDVSEVLSGSRIKDWLSVADNQAVLDQAGVAEYVEELADKYDTDHHAKNLKTSYGQTVRITGGSYGWRINQTEETAELVKLIQSGETVEREPVYSQKAASRGANDYGDTYVEINLTAQHLFYYVNGELLVESDFVSGNLAKGYDTPPGAYSITYTQRNATLRGEATRRRWTTGCRSTEVSGSTTPAGVPPSAG